jgi:uncharacterized protein (TIGR02145 family)
MKKSQIFVTTLLLLAIVFNLKAQVVKIGKQTWMTKNLNVSTFSNGDSIPQAKSFEEMKSFKQLGKAFWCYYNFDSANEEKYGKLYNDFAINDPRGLAPAGFHIPSVEEWTMLTKYLGGSKSAFLKLSSKTGWNFKSNRSNASGFTALPGGQGSLSGFEAIGAYGCWWTNTKDEVESKGVQELYGGKEKWQSYVFLFGFSKEFKISNNFSTSRLLSVRCIKD